MVENCMQEPDYEGVYDSTAWIITAASYLMPVAMAHSQSVNFQCVDVGSIKNLVTMYVENAAHYLPHSSLRISNPPTIT